MKESTKIFLGDMGKWGTGDICRVGIGATGSETKADRSGGAELCTSMKQEEKLDVVDEGKSKEGFKKAGRHR